MDEKAATAIPAAPRSIGERLRAGRERSGLSIAAAAEKLHLDSKVIEALEADRFAELGASVYVRGHLRRYGDFVGEAGTELVGLYTARDATAHPPPPDLTQIPQAERRADPRRLVTPFLGLSCAAVLLAAIWWVLAGSRSKPEDATALVTPVVQPDVEANTGNPAPGAATTVAMGSSTPVSPPPSATATPPPATAGAGSAATKPATVAEATPAPARETRLKLDLTNDSWVEVYDSRGQRLFYDVASAGSVQSVSGRGPLRVVLGNAAGVTVEVDGQSRQIPDSAIDGEGASFVVNRSGSLSRAR
ncbi:MAG TPA: RodZ domain-containing protein [Steroidobacteraceae bacterium]|nr:RodZ domain-containing protein [Steroidobacteraceae bacterium]